MELSRQEYPAIVSSVQPVAATKLIRERVQKGVALTQEIADWLQERRRVEEAYVQALSKLCRRPTPGDSSELGVFTGPWHRVVESTTAIAQAHQHLADKIAAEVEHPIREFILRNNDWAGMKNMEGNLTVIAKSIESAEEKAEKLKKRGTKAKAQQVADAATAVQNAYADWDSQAPFVFERFQVADEARCNNLKDALTRLQTLELDRTQTSMQAVEGTLAQMLDIDATQETKAFANKATGGRQTMARRQSRTSSRGTGAAVNPSTPSIITDDAVSVQSSQSGGITPTAGHGQGLGLKRLGTVLRSSKRHSIFHRSASPDTRLSEKGRVPGLPHLGSPKHSNLSDGGNLTMPSSSHSNRDESEMSPPSSQNGTRGPNSTIASSIPPSSSGSNQAPSGLSHVETPKTDAEGFSIPTSHDPIQDMMGENGSEEHQPQFKVEIKNDVIQEEEGEADAALSKVANTLRAQNTVSRRVRGRRDARDVRNTMYVPNPPELSESFGSKPSESFSSTASPPLTPIKLLPRSSTITSASEAGSDTQSIRSSRSMSSLSAHIMRHPELTEAGLSASIIESVNASFEPGNPVKVQVIGEVAISYHPHDTAPPAEKASIRLDNFEVLEKVAPNPAFLSALPGKMGEYSISLNSLRKTAVALKYQVHVDPANSHHFYPIIVSSTWRLEPHQSSVILTWKPNPDFRSATSEPIFLRNVMFMIGIEGAHASSCQSKPVGTFSREKGRIMWKMDSITIDPSKPDEVGKMLARFATDGQARAGPAEARWEITDSTGMGSTLALSVEEKKMEAVEEDASDPFADDGEKPASEEESEGASDAPKTNWQNVKTVRKLMSGKYIVI